MSNTDASGKPDWIKRAQEEHALKSRISAPYERKAVWDAWGDRTNRALKAIDGWYGEYSHHLPLPARDRLGDLMRELSESIVGCPGKPGNERFVPKAEPALGELLAGALAAAHPDGAAREIYPPVYAVGDEAVRRMDEGLALRAKQRRQAAAEVWLMVAVVGVGAFAIGWWLVDFLRG